MPERIYRCSDGHLYTANLAKAVLLSVHFFSTHYQRCPVDGRWRWAKPVNPSDLSPAELEEARSHSF